MLRSFLQSLAKYGLAYAGRNPAEAHFEEPKMSEKFFDAIGTKVAPSPAADDARHSAQKEGSK